MTQQGSADIGVTGLAVMGRNLARNLARHGLRGRAAQPLAGADPQPGRGARRRGHVRARRVDGGLRGQPAPAAGDHHHGQGGPGHRRGDRRAGPAAGRRATSSSTAATRTSSTPGAARPRCASTACTSSAAAYPAARRARCSGPSIMPGGSDESYARLGPMFESIAAQVDGTPCCMHVGPGRRRPLRQDGAQRHRVRRHAAHRRGLRPAPGRPGRARRPRSPRSSAPGTRATWTRSSSRSPREVLAHTDAGDREAVRRHRARPGRAEGHRPLDGAERARPGHPDHRHRRGDVRPGPVRARGPARGGPGGVRRRSAPPAGQRPRRVHRGRPPGAVRLQGGRLRAGLRPHRRGQRGVRLGHRPRRDGDHLARRLHHPGPVPEPHPGGLRRRTPTCPACWSRRTSPTAVQDGVDSWRRVVAQAATAGIPTPGVLLVAGLLRRAAPGPAARRADPGPAGQLRRAHLPPGGRRAPSTPSGPATTPSTPPEPQARPGSRAQAPGSSRARRTSS